MGQRAHCLDIDELLHRIRGRFEEHRCRRLLECRLPLGEVGPVDEGGFDSPAGEQLVEDDETRPEQATGGDHPVAFHQRGEERVEHGGHTGSGGPCSLRALELPEPLLEHGDSGIAAPRIDVAVKVTGERGLSLLRRPVHVARGEKETFGGLVEPRAHQSAPRRNRVPAILIVAHRQRLLWAPLSALLLAVPLWLEIAHPTSRPCAPGWWRRLGVRGAGCVGTRVSHPRAWTPTHTKCARHECAEGRQGREKCQPGNSYSDAVRSSSSAVPTPDQRASSAARSSRSTTALSSYSPQAARGSIHISSNSLPSGSAP